MNFPVFRVFYSSTFSVFLVVLLGLLLVSPGDIIYHSYLQHEMSNIIIIACVYFATLLVSAFIFATRIYTTRTHLASIPRPRAPIRKGDVSIAVRRVIQEGLMRSASIAWNAHPKDPREEDFEADDEEQGGQAQQESASSGERITSSRMDEKSGAAQPRRSGGWADNGRNNTSPPWGIIEHPGWSSPASPDLPGVQFAPVIAELVHLLEAKAVSLAPADLLNSAGQMNSQGQDVVGDDDGLPDADTVALLQRPASMGARDYIFQLMDLGMLRDEAVAAEFLRQYEAARFSGGALPEATFRQLMNTFSSLLGSLAPPDLKVLAAVGADPTPSNSPPLTSAPSTSSLRSSSRASSVLHRFATAHQDSDVFNSGDPPSTMVSAEGGLRVPLGPHLTPYFTPRPGSFSSNDGDHDTSSGGGGSDSGSARTIHTAWTGPSRSSRMGNRSASRSTRQRPTATTRHSSSYCTPRLESRHSSREDLDVVSVADSDGSVVRRVRTSGTSPADLSTPAAATTSQRSNPDYFGRWG